MGITASVGLNGINKSNDVRTVQKLLNDAVSLFRAYGATQKSLTVDGSCGNKTNTAIGAFQSLVMKFYNPDQRIDPGKSTWKKLNSNVASVFHLRAKAKTNGTALDNLFPWLKKQATFAKQDSYGVDSKELARIIGDLERRIVNNIHNPRAIEITPLAQSNPEWGKTLLGNSSNRKISGYGCTLACLTMAATYLGQQTKHWPVTLLPKNLTILKAHDIIIKAGAFADKSASMVVADGGRALGMTAVESGVGTKVAKSARGVVDACLAKGGLVLAHVDYRESRKQASWLGDHWILIIERGSDGSYLTIDPAGGLMVKLFPTPDPKQDGNDAKHPYIIAYGKSASVPAGASKKSSVNIPKYKMVRYVTLSSQ